MNDTEITADGWGRRFLIPMNNKNDQWERCFFKALEIVEKSGMVFLIGNRGSGKTTIAAEISRSSKFQNDLNRKTKTSCYRRVCEILMELRDAARSSDGLGESQIIRRLSSYGLLVIDEFQERGETAWENRILTTIIDRRYADNLPTIIIGNIELKDIHRHASDSIISRLNECGGIIDCKNNSFREKP